MDKYRLIINFKEDDLKEIAKKGKKVVIIKRNAEHDTSIVWGAFHPWQRNIIVWEDKFAVYATNAIQKGDVIDKLTEKSAVPGIQYDIAYGFFEEKQEEREKSSYFVKHMMDGYQIITVGLAQDIVINGQLYKNNPINAVAVTFSSMVSMRPTERIEIGLAPDVTNSMILANPLMTPYSFECDKQIKEYIITYDGETGVFI